MKKLNLDALAVESFTPSPNAVHVRGTVAGQMAAGTLSNCCPDSWQGTCYISCWETCPCTDGPNCA